MSTTSACKCRAPTVATGSYAMRADLRRAADAETSLVGAMRCLRSAGYRSDFSATDDGHLAGSCCGVGVDPALMRIDRTFRYEGDSNPGDESILFAITCSCGTHGLFTSAYGYPVSPADELVLGKLIRAPDA